jgi:hypothetical protein
LKAIYKCDNAHLKIFGRDFHANLIILDSKGIDVILRMRCLTACDAVIQCAKRPVLLTSLAGERFEFAADPAPSNASAVNKLDGTALEDIRVVCDYPDVFPEELPGMPPDRDVEFVIDLLPDTAPISKHPYRMSSDQLQKLKAQIKELMGKGFIRASSSPWGPPVIFVGKKDGTQRMCVFVTGLVMILPLRTSTLCLVLRTCLIR